MPRQQRVTNEEIVVAYQATGSVWKAGKRLGICGQSVHERLVAIGHPLASRRWTEEEETELLSLVESKVTAGEIAQRLGRSFASVTCKLSELGKRGYKATPPKKIPRGAGFDKVSVANHLRVLEATDTPVTRYCRANGMSVDNFVAAAQRHFPDRWKAICAARSPIPEKQCPYCSVSFVPANGKQTYCTRLCQGRARADRSYFGGKRMTAIGMAEGVCQVCGKQGHRRLTPHHVIGKENDPDNDIMIALCSGCHQLVTLLGARNMITDEAAMQTLITLAWLRRHGDQNLTGKELYVELTIDVDDADPTD